MILIVATSAVVLRLLAARESRSHAAWFVLLPFVVGAGSLQLLNWTADVAPGTGVPTGDVAQLVVAWAASFDVAAAAWFAASTARIGRNEPVARKRIFLSLPILVGLMLTTAFLATPTNQRFVAPAQGTWWWYAGTWTIYVGVLSAVSVVFVIEGVAQLPRWSVVRCGLVMIGAGCFMELLAIIARGARWLGSPTPALVEVGFWTSAARFVLVGAGWTLVAVLPLFASVVARRRHRRLQKLALEVTIGSLPPRPGAQHTAWGQLHERVIMINDQLIAIRDAPDQATTRQRVLAHHFHGSDATDPCSLARGYHRFVQRHGTANAVDVQGLPASRDAVLNGQ
ncbi:hypothetical protein [Tsukamurella paurometabola]|uniref:hypothetical protein n=1 Tax=Tsukamurella paurometabola TaxID=2061 RepID=UPI000F7D891E|nr:hypothetical protein [Tsukamurella paurometabola]UEA81452.1 hypothetical protein LK411_13650 [Tsukamurella paurometabola]